MCVFFEAGSEDLLAGHLYCATFFGKGILFDRFESVSAAYPPWPSIGLGWVSGRPGDLYERREDCLILRQGDEIVFGFN
jgi:hypothetical protein